MWSDLAAWFASPSGQRTLTETILPVVAILIAAVLAALIARSAVRRLERRLDRDALTAAVGGFVEAARRTASGDPDPGSAARLATESDVRLRLSGRPGADLAAEWALLVSLAARGDDSAVVRDRLLEWVRRPGRARRLFATDLEALHASEPAPQATAAAPAPRPEPVSTPQAAAAPPPPRPEPVSTPQATAATPPPPRPEPVSAPEWATSAGSRLVDRPAAVAATDHTNQERRAPVAEAPEAAPAPIPQPLQPVQAAESGQPALADANPGKPSWLDDYDDDAHVTRNIPLSTPAPVPASTLRDRGGPDDLVPS